MTKETGGSAFPHENHLSHRGMTLRDYFAAKALPSMMHADAGRWEGNYKIHAERAYKYADAMLEARKQ